MESGAQYRGAQDRGPPLPKIPKRKPVAKAKAQSPTATRSFTPHAFVAFTLLGTILFTWPLRWIISGAPLLVYSILLGESNGSRVLPHIPLWTIFVTLNLIYAVVATSWLLYWVFAVLCYPSLLLTCLFQFDAAANFARWAFRTLLRDFHFIRDTISFFNLPALEIDTEVNGLLVVRGLTFSLSTLTATAHGVEVGIKLSDDMELAIQTERVTISLLRKIDIGDVYANVKGGEYEMTFGTLPPDTRDRPSDDLVVADTPILIAAGSTPASLTSGKAPKNVANMKETIAPVIRLSPDEENARGRYEENLRHISETSTVNIARETLKKAAENDENNLNLDSISSLHAAICTHIHDQPSIPHPPKKSIRVSTLQKSPLWVKTFLHRLPFLLRVLLNPISYFHPIFIKTITAAGSGKWFVLLMQHHFFKHYSTQDPAIRRLEKRISAWLADANFAVELGECRCTAHVPIDTTYDIDCYLNINELMAYRTLPEGVDLTEVVRLGGADATASIPSFLLPHHEHLLPKRPTEYEEMVLEEAIQDAEGTPKAVQLSTEKERLQMDETNIKISAHAHLPVVFDQELLNFVAALVKATKVIELEREYEDLVLKRTETAEAQLELERELQRSNSLVSDDVSIASTETDTPVSPSSPKSFGKFMRKMDRGFKDMNVNMKDGWRKAGINTVNAMANDRWIAKIVGNVMKKMEKAQGDVGYSGNIPVPLAPYRERAEKESKILA